MGLAQPKLDSLGRVGLSLSVFVAVASLIDLLVNRLLFRAGPETLSHLYIPGISEIAAAGRISFTFEQAAVFIILGASSGVILLRSRGPSYLLGALIVPQLGIGALLYFAEGPELVWALNLALLTSSIVLIMGFIGARYRRVRKGPLGERALLISMGLAFALVLYYRTSLLVGSIDAAALPMQMEAYMGAVVMAMVTSVAAFAYAFTVRSPDFRNSAWNAVKVLALPTLVVGSFLYGLMESYFMTQIFAMVIAMSTDIVLSFNMVRAIIVSSWFLLSAILFLVAKGRHNPNRFLLQQAMGLVLVLSASFLFNYANYILLSTAGVLLVTVPLVGEEDPRVP